MYTLYRSPAAFYECLISHDRTSLYYHHHPKKFSVLPLLAKNFVLINLYNPNTKNEQAEVLNTLKVLILKPKLKLFTGRRLPCIF